jgi:hypothetical protein
MAARVLGVPAGVCLGHLGVCARVYGLLWGLEVVREWAGGVGTDPSTCCGNAG